MDLNEYGYDGYFETGFRNAASDGCIPGRVLSDGNGLFQIVTPYGEVRAAASGKLKASEDYPVTGDFVVVRGDLGRLCQVTAVLPRKNVFRRKEAGETSRAQVLSANLDALVIVCGLDHDFNPRRIERYLTAAWDGGCEPVIALNKADLVDDPSPFIEEVKKCGPDVFVLAVSAVTGLGLEGFAPFRGRGRTLGFTGSSGAGKSSLLNALSGALLAPTATVREDDSRGRHTTTRRALFMLGDGTLVLDTPGLREIGVFAGEEALSHAFADIAELAGECRFQDCSHETEPGCAVRKAVETGVLDEGRLESWRKLERENRYNRSRSDFRLELAERSRWKKIAKDIRKIEKENGK